EQDSLNLIKLGDLSVAAKGENKVYPISTDKLNVEIQSKGGNLNRITLKEHLNEENKPLPIIEPNKENYFYF
ncbi:MAG TPA: YidC/Oxa1 family insertase periplasmic-domain containing protein, partial [Chitinophagaceae bacterium]|nr:YidC/Oxa1 family insertase periplasmic-domain containing protein [Chitinophagaceae bacterium]